MESSIIKLLSNKKDNALKASEIASLLEINEAEVKDILIKLSKEGIVYKKNNDRYVLTSNTSLKRGVVKLGRKSAIVILDDNTEYGIFYKDQSKLKNNDTVLVKTYENGVAKIIKIVNRKYYDYVAEVIKEGKTYKAVAPSKEDIILNEPYPLGMRLLIDGEDNTVKKIIGHKDDTGQLEREILALNDFPIAFSREYLEELDKIPMYISEDEIENDKRDGLRDLRKINLVTIDGDDTKDFDDAVCYYHNTIYIAIADINRYIKEGTSIWNETLRRGISVYPPGCVNPMTHEKLSNGICSLIPNEDRYAVVVAIKLDDNGRPIDYRICKSIINNRKRMTYSEVNNYLEDNTIIAGYEEYTDILDNLYNEAMKVKKKMLEEGFLEFSSDEVKFLFENSSLIDIKGRKQGKAEELIEFLMLLHNIVMTDYFLKNKLPFISRYHGEPNNDKLILWNNLLKQRGYHTLKVKHFSAEDIKERQRTYLDSPERIILDSIAVRSQSKAKYSAYNIGHYALGLKAYATFSSPIRRLSDFINQKIYEDALEYGVEFARDKWTQLAPYIAKLATDSEIRAIKVERKIDDIRKAEYMEKFIGSSFKALVAEVKESFIKILLPEKMIYGKIFIDRRYYHLSKDGFSLLASDGSRILVGDEINVTLCRVNKNEGELFFIGVNKVVKEQYDGEEKKSKKKIKGR